MSRNREDEIRKRAEQRNRERGCFMFESDRREYDRRNWETFDLQLLDFADALEEALEKALKDSGRSTALEQQVRDLQDANAALQETLTKLTVENAMLTEGIKDATAAIKANNAKFEAVKS